MSHFEPNPDTRKLESRIAALEEMLAALERTVVEQSEHLQRSSEAQLRLAAIVESSEEGIISFGPDLKIMSWNRGAEKLFGFTAQEAIGHSCVDLYVPPELREHAFALMREDLTDLQARSITMRRLEVAAVTRSGARIEVSIVVSGIYDSDGNLLGMSNVIRDITESKRAECDLARLAAIVESSSDAITSLSLDQKIVSWNRGAEKLFGFSAAEAVGQSITIIIPPDQQRFAAQVVSEIEANPHRTFTFEAPNLRKDGRLIETSMTIFGICDRDGKLLGVSSIHRDVTERRRAESEQGLLAAIVTSTDDAVVSLSRNGRISSWNRGAEALLGFSAGEAIGQPITLYLPAQMHAFAQEGVRLQLEDAQNHKPLQRLETQVQRKDGTLLDVSIVFSGIYDSAGGLLGLSGIIRDVTERKRVERELATLASIVDGSDDAIIGFSRELKITSWNAAAEATYGFTAREAIGRGFDLFVSAEELPRALDADRRLFETGQPVSFEQRSRNKDGAWFVSLVNIFPIRDALGNIVAGAGIGRDVTKLKEIEKELRQSHEYTRGLIESSVDAMVMVDGEQRITDGNEQLARLTEIPKKFLFGSPFESIFADPQAARQALQKAFTDGYVTDVDLLLNAASGKQIPISFNASLFYRDGKVFGIFGVARDVTQQRATERTLREDANTAAAWCSHRPTRCWCAIPTCF